MLATAPDDEILAEILALQSELLQQSIVNRQRLAAVLQQVPEEAARQAAASQQRTEWAETAKACQLVGHQLTGNHSCMMFVQDATIEQTAVCCIAIDAKGHELAVAVQQYMDMQSATLCQSACHGLAMLVEDTLQA